MNLKKIAGTAMIAVRLPPPPLDSAWAQHRLILVGTRTFRGFRGREIG